PPRPTLFPYTTLFRSLTEPRDRQEQRLVGAIGGCLLPHLGFERGEALLQGLHLAGRTVGLLLRGADAFRARLRPLLQRLDPSHRSEEHTSELQSRENL